MADRSHLHGYGPVLVLILAVISFQLAAPDADWARYVSVLLQAGAIVAVAHAAGARGPVARAVLAAVFVLLIASTALLIAGELGRVPVLALLFMLSVVAPVVIVVQTARDLRADGRVTLHAMFAVLCVYLLLGLLFATIYGLIHEFADSSFFAQPGNAEDADFIYFSFSTMTTTGYGDLTAAESLGRSLAITEALVGQIYLVTVVALIVSNIGRERR
jgi:hypothetical protein